MRQNRRCTFVPTASATTSANLTLTATVTTTAASTAAALTAVSTNGSHALVGSGAVSSVLMPVAKCISSTSSAGHHNGGRQSLVAFQTAAGSTPMRSILIEHHQSRSAAMALPSPTTSMHSAQLLSVLRPVAAMPATHYQIPVTIIQSATPTSATSNSSSSSGSTNN